ncbi:hypothetical protein HYE23_02815 [Mycoplasmopsis bovis]|nr:hypothetical protein [Mycoplasmopsis bovis]QQH23796.1 hypothetical protein HYE23_02815 [Mycoplasmopsis bovis]
MNKYKRYNLRWWTYRINDVEDRLKKVKGSGRPKKTKSNDEILDEFLNLIL